MTASFANSCKVATRLLLTLLASFAIFSKVQGRDLIEIPTPYFTVVSALNESDTRNLIDQMRAFQAIVTTLITDRDLRPQVPLRIYLVGSYDWDKYLTTGKGVEGLMLPRSLSFTAALDGQSWLKASRVLFHEYVHFAVRNGTTGDYPRWFDEGLAEFLSTVETSGKKIKFGVPPADRLDSLGDFGGAHWIPLRKVLANEGHPSDDDDWRAHAEELGFYSESWALVHYSILAMPGGGKALVQYVRLCQQGVAIDDAFSRAFRMSIEQMEENLKHYVEGERFPYRSADISTLSLPAFGVLKSRQLSTMESTLEMGKLISLINPKSLLPYFEKFAKAEPKNGLALAAKANALALDKQYGPAQSLLTQVLVSKPTDPEILLMAGDIQDAQAFADDKSIDRAERDRLRRKSFEFYDAALKDPYNGFGDVEIVEQYANRALEYNSSLDRALLQVEHARKLYPIEPRLAALNAKLLLAQNRPKEARDAWAVTATYGRGRLRIEALDAVDALDVQLRAK